jgi:bla regulator protein BlaR1
MKRTMKQTILGAMILGTGAWCQSFEAASIRPRADEHVVSLRFDSGRLSVRNDALQGLIMWGWNLKTYQVIGLPKWAEDERYDIDAKAPDDTPVTQESGRTMMASLLAERFHLKTHRETREMAVYDLVVMKGGPKFRESAPDAEPSLSLGGPRAWNRLKVAAGTMTQLALQLSVYQEIGRPVIDKTGLAGRYDYAMKSAVGTPSMDDPEVESTFTALQDQLGLKLEPSKANIEVLVIENAEHPSSN